MGTPVVGSKMGGIPELIEPGKTGELFEAGNVEELMKAIKKVLQTQDVLERYTKNCSQVNYETTESYYIKLMKIYRGEKNAKRKNSSCSGSYSFNTIFFSMMLIYFVCELGVQETDLARMYCIWISLLISYNRIDQNNRMEKDL